MASELRVNTLKDAAGNNSIATSFVAGGSAKHFCHFDSGTTIDTSFNTSTLTDNGTGDYTCSFTSSLSVLDSPFLGFSLQFHHTDNQSLTGSCKINTFNSSHSAADASRVTTVCLGDLA